MSIIEKFENFDRANPEVWRLFVKFTEELIAAGRQHYSSDAVIHRIRWETAVKTDSDDEFKINNNYTAHYARKFHDLRPQYADFFRTRERRAA